MINPVRPDEWEYYLPLQGKRMLELGNKINPKVGVSYKQYFESIGIEHTSIDWNGKDGALKLDLRKKLWDQFEPFDMVTNIGTTEHVSDQAPVWENIHYLTKVGGVLVSTTPYPEEDNWYWHGEWYPKETFFVEFAKLNGWEIDRMGTNLPKPNKNLYVRMIKVVEKPFTMPDMSHIHYNKMRPRHA